MKIKIAVFCATLCLIGSFVACGGGVNTPVPTSTSSGYQQTNLVSDTAGSAAHTDPGLLNPWGVAFCVFAKAILLDADNNPTIVESWHRQGVRSLRQSGNPAIRQSLYSLGRRHPHSVRQRLALHPPRRKRPAVTVWTEQ